MGSIYVICSRQCPNGDGIYTLLYALYKYSTSITNQPTKKQAHTYPVVYSQHVVSEHRLNRFVPQMRVPLAACREPAGKLWQLCKVLYAFEDKM